MSLANLPESITEIIEKLNGIGAIGKVVGRYLDWMIQPDEVILLAYPQLQLSETASDAGVVAGGTFGSLELKMLTNQRFLTLGIFPTYHHFDVKDVHKISHYSFTSRFSTGYEGEGDVTTAEERGYNPREIEMEVRFEDAFGREIFLWNQDASRGEDIKILFQFVPILSRISGKLLQEQKG